MFNKANKIPRELLKIYFITLAFVVLLSGSMIYAISTAFKANIIAENQVAAMKKMEALGQVNEAFGVFRTWTLDLMISTQRDSLLEAKKASQNLNVKIENLGAFDEKSSTLLLNQFQSLRNSSFAASDAYIANNKILGNSLMATARVHADELNITLSKQMNEANSQLKETASVLLENSNDMMFNLTILGAIALCISLFISTKNIASFFGMEKAKQSLLLLSQNLEKTVDLRTQQIRTITDNVQNGFFLVDSSLKIEQGYTKSCSRLLEVSPEDKFAFEIFSMESNRDTDNLKCLLEQIFECPLAEDLSIAQLPTRFRTKSGKLLSAIPSPVKNESGETLKLLFNITDITELEQAEKATQQQQTIISILKRKEGFLRYLNNAKVILNNAHKFLALGKIQDVKPLLHTLKGNSSSFGLNDLSKLIHNLEGNFKIDAGQLLEIEKQIVNFLEVHFEVLGLKWDSQAIEIFEISLNQFEFLEKAAEETSSVEGLKKAIFHWLRDARMISAGCLVFDVEPYVLELAQRLEKRVDFVVQGENVKVDHKLLGGVCENLIHVFRNSLDHGIESGKVRLASGKKVVGKIEVVFSETQNFWQIDVSDDGGGINTTKVLKRAIETNLVAESEAEDLNEDDIFSFVFEPDFSTASKVTEVSGRGVGLSSLRDAVNKVRGSIKIQSVCGLGTTFQIVVPKSQDTQVTLRSAS